MALGVLEKRKIKFIDCLLGFLKFTLHAKKTMVVAPICASCLPETPSTAVLVPLACSWKMMAGHANQVRA